MCKQGTMNNGNQCVGRSQLLLFYSMQAVPLMHENDVKPSVVPRGSARASRGLQEVAKKDPRGHQEARKEFHDGPIPCPGGCSTAAALRRSSATAVKRTVSRNLRLVRRTDESGTDIPPIWHKHRRLFEHCLHVVVIQWKPLQ